MTGPSPLKRGIPAPPAAYPPGPACHRAPCAGSILVALIAACLTLSGCKVVATSEKAQSSKPGVGAADNKVADPERMAQEIWGAKVLPYLDRKAGPFPEVMALMHSAPESAANTWGHRATEGAPPVVATRLEGRIVSADLASRAAVVGVDADGDGKADVNVQIGPVIRGTALRDALDFVSFDTFANQIEFAKFGKALNGQVDRAVLAGLPRENLVGRAAEITGVFPLSKPGETPLVTPAVFKLGAAP